MSDQNASEPRANDHRRRVGQAGEEAAAQFLEARGYEIVARNWRARAAELGFALRGEIDLIARCGAVLCFIEVKARTTSTQGAPQEAVNQAKQKQLSRLANAYLSLHGDDETPCRFDVVEVWGNSAMHPEKMRCVHHENAFDFAL